MKYKIRTNYKKISNRSAINIAFVGVKFLKKLGLINEFFNFLINENLDIATQLSLKCIIKILNINEPATQEV